MDFAKFQELFEINFTANGLDAYITHANVQAFYELTRLMLEKNSVMNITAIKKIDQIIPLHYADCVKTAKHFPKNALVADIGCGGGFPTLPLAIVRPDLQITAIDSTEKKVNYVAETAKALGLNVKTVAERAETLANQAEYREKYDIVTSRAVARLNILNELCLPFVKIGGQMIVMKGAAGEEENTEAMIGTQKLGGEIKATIRDDLMVREGDIEKRVTIVIDKVLKTPPKYPRQFGQIKKKPL